jgi:uncharacterized cupin superfamily protein
MSTATLPVRDRLSTAVFEPLVPDDSRFGEISWLRTTGSSDRPLMAGLWRSGASSFDYEFPADESFYVIDGAVTIELPATGETIELQAGDVASFDAGTASVWTIGDTFTKFTVLA